jgi:hypothetical protein
MLGRPLVRYAGAQQEAPAGVRPLDQLVRVAINGDNQNLTVAAIIAGFINRTGTTANTTDVLPSADELVAALPELSVGDSFNFMIRMANAHTNTLTLGTGIEAFGTTGIVASNIREYVLTLLSGNARTRVVSGSTTNANAVLTNIAQADLAALRVGMGVTGTGIAASSYIVGINLTAGTVTMNQNATATGSNIALTFFPRFEIAGLRTAAI